MTVNQPTLEKMFNLMDTNKTGVLNFDQFYEFLKVQTPAIDLITHQ